MTQPMLNTAVSAAIAAGKIINKAAERLDTLEISMKSDNTFVSNVDKKAEQAITKILLKAYPDHQILGEEGGLTGEESDYVWIIDPLDGTHNFIRGIPHYCVSIALRCRGNITCGVIYDPVRQELFTALRGRGAKLNDHRLRLDQTIDLSHAVLGMGYLGDEPQQWKTFEKLSHATKDVRRSGSAALDLAYVAANRLDAFVERGLKIWDIAAGVLMVHEAGGLVCDIDGGENYAESGNIFAAQRKLCKPLLQILKDA